VWGAAGAALLLSPALWVQGVGQASVVPDPADVPHTDVALVLGAGLRPGGTPSTYLARRLTAAADLYAAGTVRTIVASGDGVSPYHDEPGAMRDRLIELGVPSTAIILDREGIDTHTSCVRARDLLDVTEAVVITQDYHLRRALFSCRTAGIDAVGVGVASSSVQPTQFVVWHLREVPASVKAAWDALVG